MHKFIRAGAIAGAAAVVALTASACSSTPSPAPSPATPTASPSVGGDPSTWTPLSLTLSDNGSTQLMTVGQAAVFTDLPAAAVEYVVESDNPSVAMPEQGGTSDGVTTAPGLTAKSPGTAQVVLYDGNPADSSAQPVMQITVQVMADAVGGNPGTWTPAAITLADNDKTVNLVKDQTATFDLPAGSEYIVESSAPTVVKATSSTTKDGVKYGPGLVAVASGTAAVTVFDSSGQPVLTFTVKVM